jgi:glycosyltransferase involved in cell wall biosynthesis
MARPSVVFLAPAAYRLGGVQVWLANLLPQLQQRGWRVRLALTAGRWHDVDAYGTAFPGLPLLPVANPSGSEEGRRRAIGRMLAELQPDLVAGVNIAALYPAVARQRRQGAFSGRAVMTLHALQADLLAHLAAQRPVIDAVIATNRLACSLSQGEAGIAPERVLYAPYGVTVPPEPPRVRAERPGAAPLRLAWIGRLSQDQKRVLDLPAILTQLDRGGLDVRLSVAGDGPEAAALERALAPWIARGTVQLLGRLDGADLQRRVYADHDALLITSSWETGPIVAWEAMAAGLVVVSSRYVGHRLEGALDDGRNALLFPVGDAEAAAAALSRLADPALRAALMTAGHGLVRGRYSEAVSFAAWEEALEQSLSLPALAPPDPPPPASAGRLDRWLGAGTAEDLRRLLRLRFQHPEPGSEWPHTDRPGGDESLLLQRAAALETAAAPTGEVRR